MVDVNIISASEERDYHFGSCPYCLKCDGLLNVGRGHWLYCDEHKTRWYVGSNLFGAWKHETEAEQRARYVEKDFGNYQDVEPHYTLDFWDALKHEIASALASPSEKMAAFLDDYRGLWPKIETEIAIRADRRALLDRALQIRDGETCGNAAAPREPG